MWKSSTRKAIFNMRGQLLLFFSFLFSFLRFLLGCSTVCCTHTHTDTHSQTHIMKDLSICWPQGRFSAWIIWLVSFCTQREGHVDHLSNIAIIKRSEVWDHMPYKKGYQVHWFYPLIYFNLNDVTTGPVPGDWSSAII